MTLTLQISLKPQDEARLALRAEQQGLTLDAYVQMFLERLVSSDPRMLRLLPREERNRILAVQAAEAAELYEADLARPLGERELTAFTALDGEPVYDHTS